VALAAAVAARFLLAAPFLLGAPDPLAGAAGTVAAGPQPRPHPGRVIEAGGARLFVETEGSGPALVLLPAAPGIDHAYFHPYLSSLADTATVVYYDPAGCGRSGPPAGGGPTLDRTLRDLETLRAALGHERIDLLGHGFGAAIAVLYADRHPERAGRLILVGPTPSASAFLAAPGVLEAVTPAMRAALDAAAADRYLSADGRFRERLRTLAPLLFHRLTDRGFHRAFADGVTVTAAVFEALAAPPPDGAAGTDLLPALGRLRQPLLIVAGRHDRTAPMEGVQAVRDAVRAAPLVVLEDSGAVPFADQPVEFHRAVREFLRGEDAAGAARGERSGAGGGI
jgi:pimeloyl-ACP methyl ester carboxylesterase